MSILGTDHVRLALTLAALVTASGCQDCRRAPPPAETPTSSSSADAAPAPESSVPANTPAASVVAAGLDSPTALTADATHLYFADAHAGTINRVPREGGPPVVLARNQATPSRVALLGDDVVWLNVGSGKRTAPHAAGVFACSTKKACEVRPVREGSFAGLVVSAKDIFLTEKLDDTRFAVVRVTGPATARLGEHDGRPLAMTTDAASVYVSTLGVTSSAKIVQVPRLPGKKGEESELTLRGHGLNAIADDGDQLLGYGRHRREVRALPRGEGRRDRDPLARDVPPGVFAVNGDQVYFVSGSDLTLRKIARTGGGAGFVVGTLPGITKPTALVIVDGWAYVSGKDAGDAGDTGRIVRLSLR